MVLGCGGPAVLHARSDGHVVTARNGTAVFTLHIFWLSNHYQKVIWMRSTDTDGILVVDLQRGPYPF
jgi:hypothetical protein